ncbi:Phosphate transport system permease protein PstC (TC 3.A.1.7.1) [Thermobrachium celere DSM 8682]|uniref:Phosphate transport system permease protein n=2 Tax=Thermobrachium TaxID=150333 RepID=R7RPV7_9CLOT|nr:Phosphate transport system permease protein PstC (TC 3.A.1.7.1) [Thermobrachium celere DSM 8682]
MKMEQSARYVVRRKERTSIVNSIVDNSMKYLLLLCALLTVFIVASIIVYVSKNGINVFKEITVEGFFTSDYWSPDEGEFGILAFWRGTLILTLLAITIGGALGVLCAIYMSKFAPKKIREVMKFAIDIFVGIPSVVYGFIGLTVIVPLIREVFPDSTGFGFLPAAIILSIMILPTVISISEASISSVDKSYEEASYALGATKVQTVFSVVLPSALPGIITAIILAMARALGETMAVQMVIGNTPQVVNSLLEPTITLTTGIVMDMGSCEFGSTWSNALFMMATVLLMVSILLILIIRLIQRRQVS